MLEAVTSPLCMNPPSDKCDVCGLVFFPTWALFMPGNFWTAQCTYVDKLLHPLDFASRKKHLASYMDQLNREKLLVTSIFQDREDTRGLNRYAAGKSKRVANEVYR